MQYPTPIYKLIIPIIALFIAMPCLAKLSFDDYKKLPPLPKQLSELKTNDRVIWLEKEIDKKQSPVEHYRLQRELFMELFFEGKLEKTPAICALNPPLREDYYYREYCIDVSNQTFEAYLPQMLELIYDVRQVKDQTTAANILKDLAWRQSQHGDIAAAYGSYETALAIAPSDDIELINSIMMDTATNYIIHGDETYINKGIDLLKKIRQSSQNILINETDKSKIFRLKDDVLLTNFNTGIAYTLHLYEYEKALSYFDQVNQSDNDYTTSSLTFSALAAAEIGQYDRARNYLKNVSGSIDNDPVTENYLACYRQLTKHHWNKGQTLTNCLTLDSETTIEVLLDVYKRLADSEDPSIELFGLQKMKMLFITKLEPQLRSRGSNAASNTELRRLQRESELKSVVLKQQKELQNERDATHANRQKLFIALFVILISFILLVASQLRQKKKLAEQYQKMSIRDSLTKLGNRRFLEQQIERELAFINRAIRVDKEAALGIYIFDIDHFKKVNDTYGHQAGDEVLIEISRRITRVTRDTDLFVRWGGEEFVYIARLDNNDRTYQLAERIIETINSEPFIISNHEPIDVTCTLGVVKYPFIDTENIQLWTRLISLADAALYHGKAMQRNCWVVINNEGIIEKEQLDALLNMSLQEAVQKNIVTIRTSFD